MKKFQGFSKEKHLLYAPSLGFASLLASKFYIEVCRCYGRSSKVAKMACNLEKAVNGVRCLLDNEIDEYYPQTKHLFGEREN